MSTERFQIEIQRFHIVMVLEYLKKSSVPGAFLLGKVMTKLQKFLDAFPSASKFRLTAEAISETEPLKEDRESQEETSR